MNIVRQLITILAPAWSSMLLAAILGVLTIGSSIGLITTAAWLIASAALHPPLAELSLAIVGVRFFGLSRAILRYLERYIAHDATFRLLSLLRVWLYTALEPLAPARLMHYRSGELLSRVIADVETLQYLYLRIIAPPVVAILILAMMMLFLGQFDAKLAYLLAVAFGLSGLALPSLSRLMNKETANNILTVRAKLKAHLVDVVQGLPELIAFDRIEQQTGQISSISDELVKLQRKKSYFTAGADAATSLIINLTVWLTLVLTIPLATSGQFDKIYLAVLALAVQSSFEAVMPLPLVLYYWEESMAAAKRIFAIIDNKPAVAEQTREQPLPNDLTLNVSGLKFAYHQASPWVLDDITFCLPPEKRMAIVGPSGTGKSTLVSLLLRFWDYEEGLITIGGNDIKAYQPEQVRTLFGVVSQHTHLFNATIRDNILLAYPAATDEQLQSAVQQTAIAEFIASLPAGYDTYVGQSGSALSGGQRQRLAIARAILKDAPILILDEPTVGLDPVMEQEVMSTIEAAMAGRTTILITHRLTGLEKMDEILVLDKGKIIERGSQAELLANNGLFYRLWRMQHDAI